MAKFDQTYHKLLETIFQQGRWYDDPNRKGVKRLQIPHYTLEHNFSDGFPALTTKKAYFVPAVGELLSFLRGDSNINQLKANGVNFWHKDAYNFYKRLCEKDNWESLNFEDWLEEATRKIVWPESAIKHRHAAGQLGKIYPYQMRSWSGEIDQITNLIKTLKENPMATKKTVTMWNPSDLEDSALSACHFMFQALVEPLTLEEKEEVFLEQGGSLGELDWISQSSNYEEELTKDIGISYSLKIKFSIHSSDVFLGLPTNVLYYSTLCYLFAELCNMKPLGIIADLSNVHLYDNQIEVAKEQLKRDTDKYNSPSLKISNHAETYIHKFNGGGDIDYGYYNNFDNLISALSVDDFELKNYESYPALKVEMLSYDKA